MVAVINTNMAGINALNFTTNKITDINTNMAGINALNFTTNKITDKKSLFITGGLPCLPCEPKQPDLTKIPNEEIDLFDVNGDHKLDEQEKKFRDVFIELSVSGALEKGPLIGGTRMLTDEILLKAFGKESWSILTKEEREQLDKYREYHKTITDKFNDKFAFGDLTKFMPQLFSAAQLKRKFDINGNGKLDNEEQRAYKVYVAELKKKYKTNMDWSRLDINE